MHELGSTDIDKVVQGGTGLAFISYPDAIAKFDVVPQVCDILYVPCFRLKCVICHTVG
jgi:solute carrier family 6 amino acid transporter-like protein 5/7/9/14